MTSFPTSRMVAAMHAPTGIGEAVPPDAGTAVRVSPRDRRRRPLCSDRDDKP